MHIWIYLLSLSIIISHLYASDENMKALQKTLKNSKKLAKALTNNSLPHDPEALHAIGNFISKQPKEVIHKKHSTSLPCLCRTLPDSDDEGDAAEDDPIIKLVKFHQTHLTQHLRENGLDLEVRPGIALTHNLQSISPEVAHLLLALKTLNTMPTRYQTIYEKDYQ